MERIADALTLITRWQHAEDNVIFIRSGSWSAPYCAFSLRQDGELGDLLTWGTASWLMFDGVTEYVEHDASPEETMLRRRRACVGCGRKMFLHSGPGKMVINMELNR